MTEDRPANGAPSLRLIVPPPLLPPPPPSSHKKARRRRAPAQPAPSEPPLHEQLGQAVNAELHRREESTAVRDEGPQREFAHTGGGFSVSAPASAARVDPQDFAFALTAAQCLLMAEIAWVWRRRGRLVAGPGGNLVRAIPAPGADSHPATLNLIHGARLPAKALAHWYAPGDGALLTFTEDGRQALKHFAPALGNLDANDYDAMENLQTRRRLAGATPDVCDLMAARNQLAAPWLNAVLQQHAPASPEPGEARQAPIRGGRGEGEADAAPLFALYAGDVVELGDGGIYRLVPPPADAAADPAISFVWGLPIDGSASDLEGPPREIAFPELDTIVSRAADTAEPAATTQPEQEPA